MLFWGSHPLKEANEDILWNIGTSYDGSKFHYSVLRHCEPELKTLSTIYRKSHDDLNRKLNLKSYSPTVTHDKVFVYDFCVL